MVHIHIHYHQHLLQPFLQFWIHLRLSLLQLLHVLHRIPFLQEHQYKLPYIHFPYLLETPPQQYLLSRVLIIAFHLKYFVLFFVIH